tara:strand:+ start:786 stop:1307 length:522 start_codon:yes stop_codon:yes gene_type:complete
MSSDSVNVAGQLFRFKPSPPLILPVAAELLKIKPVGGVVVHADSKLGMTYIIDEMGRIIVHGAKNYDVARAAVTSFLLGLGKSDEGLSTEHGPVTGWFDLDGEVKLERVLKEFGESAEMDLRLGAVRIEEEQTGTSAIIWPNGRVIVPSANSNTSMKILSRRLKRRLSRIIKF